MHVYFTTLLYCYILRYVTIELKELLTYLLTYLSVSFRAG